MPATIAQDPDRLWDVVIIGAGMGGGFTSRSLAEAGYNVLLVDRGNKERSTTNSAQDDDLAQCRWPGPIALEVDGALNQHYGIFGAGVGGSTNLYAAALERFERHDLETLPNLPHPTGGWPIQYSQLLPYYEKAERLLHVAGTRDPLNPDSVDHLRQPPPLGPVDIQFMQSFANSGLHPYRLHVGIRYLPGCDECLSKLCPRNCRADSRSVIAEGPLQPTILERTEALRLEASGDRVSRVILRQGDFETSVRAKVFVLAAGAVHSPKLLFQSSSEHWPNGLANRSGMVGRNLMFHGLLRFILWPPRKRPTSGPRKSICFRDFYSFDGQRLGAIQSTGFEAGYGDILGQLYSVHNRGPFHRILRPFLRIPARLLSAVRGPGTIFASIIEDLPYPDNRVVIDHNQADGILMKYSIRQELRDRFLRLHSLLKTNLDKRRSLFFPPDVALNLSHPCGTCVMGTDPATSVIDQDCRVHGVSNLFITDASFMPTSAAINPSLTIAANALRVSEAIKQTLSRA